MTFQTIRHSYAVTGMTCGGCVKKVSGILQNIAGITSASVSINPPQAMVEMRIPIALDTLNHALEQAGAYRLSKMQVVSEATTADDETPESLYPLFLIISYILIVVGLVSAVTSNYTAEFAMNNFMAGFFIVFSFFKLLDLRGFSDAYRSYDVVAKAVPLWGFIYPYIELGLGVAYLLHIAPLLTNSITLGLMLIGSVGVLQALLQKRTIQCACLGTALKLPMTKVTLIEDLGMAAMAAAMIAMMKF